MNLFESSNTRTKFIVRGIHLDLAPALKTGLEKKVERLFRHEPDILRVRVDVERDFRGRGQVFTAKGRIEIAGPDMTASVTAESASVASGLLIDKLDRMLRKRTTAALVRRTADDIRAHVESVAVLD
jgi:putative sigma-54 modulation protein